MVILYFSLGNFTTHTAIIERTMAAIGCTVRAFDPASTQPDTVNHKNIHFYKIGIGHKTGKQKVNTIKENK